jgi:hypothetical protein
LEIPKFARDVVTDQVELRNGIAEIEQLARDCEPGGLVKLGPSSFLEVVSLMNAREMGNGQIDLLYWGVAPSLLDSVVDQVRTRLTVMVAEIRATLPDNTEVIPTPVADNAFAVAVTGKRHKVTVTAAQGSNEICSYPR